MRRDAPSELASPSLTRASHARADENGGNSVKGTGFRTLQSFAEKDLASEEIGGYNGAYFGSTSYFDDEISAALAGTANTLSTNGGDYSSAVDATREQVAKKVTAYGAVWIYALHEFEDALLYCDGTKSKSGYTATYSAQHAWDEGWAFYAGSTQVTAGTSGGNLVYYLAQKRCSDYGTCDSTTGLATVNDNMLTYVNAGLTALADCDTDATTAKATATTNLELIKSQMTVPLVQGMLKYAYYTSLSTVSADDIAEGWAFAYPLLGMINNCDPTVAATVITNMHVNAASPMDEGYDTLREAVESTYSCLGGDGGITCADVGSLSTSSGGYTMCTDAVETTSAGSIAKQGLVVSVAVVSALGAMLMAF